MRRKVVVLLLLLFMLTGCNPSEENVEGKNVVFKTNSEYLIKTVVVPVGETVGVPHRPTKEGHTFLGWFDDINFENEFDFSTIITSDVTLYAKWDINSYQITFLDVDGTILHTKSYLFGSEVAIPQVPKNTDLLFIWWDIELPLTMPAADLVVNTNHRDIVITDLDHIANYTDIGTQKAETYFVYFYSEYCSHCIAIKDQVIGFALSNTLDMKVYFLDAATVNGDMPSTLRGTPTIIVVEDNFATNYVVGSTKITDYLEELE